MIEGSGLGTRLVEQLSLSLAECRRDPRAFFHELFFDDNKDLQQRKRLRAGLLVGLLTNAALVAVIVALGVSQARVLESQNGEEPEIRVDWVPPPPPEDTKPESTNKPVEMPKGSGKGGDAAAPGGGGMNQPEPPRLGTPPQSSPLPPIVAPITPPSAVLPSLPVTPTIEGPASLPPPPEATIGSPTGVKDGGGGPGAGGGIGRGDGSGVGDNKGAGGGKEVVGDGGGNLPGSPGGGVPTGPIPYNQLGKYDGNSGIRWISRPRPIITPEAQAQKVSGTVLLRATFTADGRITDIEIVSPVAYMTESAVDSLQRSRFRPATILGKPVTLTRVPVRIDIVVN